MLLGVVVVLGLVWGIARRGGASLPPVAADTDARQPFQLAGVLAVQALLSLVAMLGWGLRFRARRNDLDRWLCLGATLALFAELHYVFTPLLSAGYVSQGDFLRLLSYVVLLVGVWRAIRFAEFGRAVAEERARVAREIHDAIRLAPDEQIEVFRIVQEGLANARKHAGARRAEVRITEREGERFVSVVDDGSGFNEAEIAPGQGLKNMRARAASIGGGL